MADIKQIRPCRFKNVDDLKQLFQTGQLAVVDPEAVGLVHHVAQYNTVPGIVEKIPTEIQKRWSYKSSPKISKQTNVSIV